MQKPETQTTSRVADFRTGAARKAKHEVSKSEAQRTAVLSEKEIQGQQTKNNHKIYKEKKWQDWQG